MFWSNLELFKISKMSTIGQCIGLGLYAGLSLTANTHFGISFVGENKWFN